MVLLDFYYTRKGKTLLRLAAKAYLIDISFITSRSANLDTNVLQRFTINYLQRIPLIISTTCC